MVQSGGRPARAAAAACCIPGTQQPIGPDDLAPLFPMALIVQEVVDRARDRDPGRGARRLSPVAADAACTARAGWSAASIPRPASTTSTRASARPAATSRTPRCPRPTTTSRRASRASPPRPGPASGARRWRSPAALFGLEVDGLHGQGQLRAEALPAGADGELRRPLRRLALGTRPSAGGRSWPRTPTAPAASGIAISEAVEMAASRDDTNYALGSVLNHVLLHQTVIGQEAMRPARAWPATTRTSSSAAPAAAPTSPASPSRSSARSCAADRRSRIVAVEPAACPILTRGKYAYDFGDTGHLTPLVKMHTLGSDLRAAGLPRRRPALPRHGAAGQPPAATSA